MDGNETLAATRNDLDKVLQVLETSKASIWHVLGNHCLEVGYPHLLNKLRMDRSYYAKDLGNWRVIVLDTVQVSVQRNDNPSHFEEANQYLQQNKHLPNAQVWNGGLSTSQKLWLEARIIDACERGMKTIICGHLPIVATDESQRHVMWENEWLIDLFTKRRQTVKAYFAGHFHAGAYVVRNDVHYVTFKSILDSSSEEGSAAVVQLWSNRIEIIGYGDMTSRTMVFPN